MGGHVQGQATAQADGRDDLERDVAVGERHLEPEREQDDPGTIGRWR